MQHEETRPKATELKTLATNVVLSFLVLAGLMGCGDQGQTTPSTAPQTPGSLSVGLDTVFTYPQDTVRLTITGGTMPYSLLGSSPSGAAMFTITESTLSIAGSSNGSSYVSIVDAASPARRLDLPVIVETEVSFATGVQPIFTGSYGCVSCHGGTRGLFLTNATVSYQNLVNVPAQSSAYIGYMRVAPRNLRNSLLYIRLASNDPSISMPQGRTAPFDSTDLSNVRTWILQGAHFN